MTGLQKAAWWSVPLLGFVFLACVVTLIILYATRPTKKTGLPKDNKVVAAKVAEEPKKKNAAQKKQRQKKRAAPKEPSKREPSEAKPAPTAAKANAPLTPAMIETMATPLVTVEGANTITSLVCTGGKIHYLGDGELRFVEKQPALKGGQNFGYLDFKAQNDSVELPDVPKDHGSIEIVVNMPARNSSVVLDSHFQRFTLRKNKDGLRWRIAGTNKQAPIRLSKTKINFKKWHHVVITWQNGGKAILYVNGAEHDSFPYRDEQPHFKTFKKVVLGRIRSPKGRYYASAVHRYNVFDEALSVEEVVKLNTEMRDKYPVVFKN